MEIGFSKEVPATPHFDFVSGLFSLSQWSIPYFTTTMYIPDAADSLRLVTEFPGWEEQNWSLEELFQRDVDWKRVEQRIVPYLKDVGPQFFNSLTVALVPLMKGAVASYDAEGFNPPGIGAHAGEIKKPVDCGPISFGYWMTWEDVTDHGARIGRVRWNPKEVFCVAIDGQHRLAALKRIAETDAAARSSVPVILLVFDPRVGFKGPSSANGIVPILRKLFIDLNKHAVKVGRSRLILLDDLDPTSRCVRHLVGERLESGAGELEGSPPRLPLSLIDWHSDSAKFDDGPYLGTILGLDYAVQTVLGTKPITDYTSSGAVRRQLNVFESKLKISLSEAKQRLKKDADFGKPFYYQTDGGNGETDELETIARAFAERWSYPIVHILTALDPYDQLIRLREELSTLDPLFVQWYQLWVKKEAGAQKAKLEYSDLVDRLILNERISPQDLLDRLNDIEAIKKDCLAFNVVFQRALFRAFADYCAVDSLVFEGYSKGALWTQGEASIEGDDDTDWDISEDEELVDDYFEDLEEDEENEEAEGESEVAVDSDDTIQIPQRRADEFVTALNAVTRELPSFWRVRADIGDGEDGSTFLWAGTLLRADSMTIDFALDASRRAADLILFAVCLHTLLSQDPKGIYGDMEAAEVWERLGPQDGQTLDSLEKRARRAMASFRTPRGNTKSAAERILQARQMEPTEELLARETRVRAEWLIRGAQSATE